MPHEVEVAVYANRLPDWEPPIGGQGPDVLYADRLKVKLLVEDDESLESVYRRAVNAFQPRVTQDFAVHVKDPMQTVRYSWFYEAGDDQTFRGKGWRMTQSLAGVGTDGLVRWGRSQAEIPYGDLVRSGRDGLLRGDPLRPYLVLVSPQGGIGGDLHAVWNAMQVCWTVLGGLGATAVAGGFLLRITKRLRGAATLRAHQDALVERGAGPGQIIQLIDARSWPLADLQVRMGLDSAEEARAVLELYGCKETGVGWLFDDASDEARFMRWAEDEVFNLMNRGIAVTKEEIERRLAEHLSSGSFTPDAEG